MLAFPLCCLQGRIRKIPKREIRYLGISGCVELTGKGTTISACANKNLMDFVSGVCSVSSDTLELSYVLSTTPMTLQFDKYN